VTATLPVAALQDAVNSPPIWKIDVGTQLQVDAASAQEVVTVTGVDRAASAFTANFTKAHTGTINVAVAVEAAQTNANGSSPVTAPGNVTITPNALKDTNTPPAWQIVPGMQIFVDTYNTTTNTQQEVVTVASVDTVAGTFSANFAYTHANPSFPIFVPL